MANRYFLNIGANWGDTANWSDTSGGTGGFSVPTSADDVFFDANSGNCTVNASTRTAKTLTCTGYINTLTISNNINVFGNVTLGAGMTVSGTSTLQITQTNASIQSNGVTWTGSLTLTSSGVSITVTLLDNWTILGNFTQNGISTINLAGLFTLYVGGSITMTVSSTNSSANSTIELNGTGTWSGAGQLRNNLTINTTGTITISGTVNYNTGTLTYTAGTVVTTGSTLSISLSTTLNTSGMTWNNISTLLNTLTITILSNLNIGGTLTLGSAVTINGAFNVNVSGNLTVNNSTGAGTATIILNGTGTWSGNFNVSNNLIINTSGTITISGSVTKSGNTLTYTAGTVVTTGSTLSIAASTTLNTSGMSWNNVTISGGTTTLTSNCTAIGNLTLSGTSPTINGLFNMNVGGNLTVSATTGSGTATIVMNGTGTWGGGFALNQKLTINTLGTITIGGARMGASVLTYISGNVVTDGSTLTIDGSGSSTTTLNTNGINWNNVSAVSGTFGILLQSDLNIYGLYTTNGGANNTTISGSFNINCYGGITNNYGLVLGTGSPTLNLYGGVWSMGSGFVSTGIQINTNIIGNITISGTVIFTTRILRYISGNVTVLRGSILSLGTSTVINCDKINFRTISISSGATITMNKYFSGSAIIPTTIRSIATHTIVFQDGFEKITKFTKISNCTVSRRGQLLCITDKSNKGGNVGVRYINQLPNGVPKNAPTVAAAMAYSVANISDPNFIIG
jgi:hypothetical protein